MVALCDCPQADFAGKGFNHEDVQYYSRHSCSPTEIMLRWFWRPEICGKPECVERFWKAEYFYMY